MREDDDIARIADQLEAVIEEAVAAHPEWAGRDDHPVAAQVRRVCGDLLFAAGARSCPHCGT